MGRSVHSGAKGLWLQSLRGMTGRREWDSVSWAVLFFSPFPLKDISHYHIELLEYLFNSLLLGTISEL